MEIVEITNDSERAVAARLADEIWHECYAQLLTEAQIEYMLERFQSSSAMAGQMAEEGYRYFLVKQGNVTAGYLGVQPKDGKLLVSKIYLAKKWRGSGMAQEVMAYAEQLGQELGCTAYWLTVNKGNTRAIAAYRKVGMKLVREQEVDIGAGFTMDDYVLEKELERTVK